MEQRAAWRLQGITWMRAELKAGSKRFEAAPEEAAEVLQLNETDKWLASLRHAAHFDQRPTTERDAFRQLWAASARLYSQSFAIEARRADDMQKSHRYNAACAAASAASTDCKAVQKMLKQWQIEADLAGLRDKEAPATLPPEEDDARRKLWADVGQVLKRAQK